MHAAHPVHFIFKVCHFKFYKEYKLWISSKFIFLHSPVQFFLDPLILKNPFSQQSQGETKFYTHAKQLVRIVYFSLCSWTEW